MNPLAHEDQRREIGEQGIAAGEMQRHPLGRIQRRPELIVLTERLEGCPIVDGRSFRLDGLERPGSDFGRADPAAAALADDGVLDHPAD